MKSCSIHSLSQTAFDLFLRTPSGDQIKTIADRLHELEVYEAPWTNDPQDWVSVHMTESDWYASLADAEDMEAWDHGIIALIERPEFEKTQHAGEHGAVPYALMEWVTEALSLQNGTAFHFGPYRYCGLGSRQDEVFYWPSYALISNVMLGLFLDALQRFDKILDSLEQHREGFREVFADEITGARESLAEELPALVDIHSRGCMWYSEFDT